MPPSSSEGYAEWTVCVAGEPTAKTGLQQVLAAVGINTARVVAWLDDRPRRATTRISRFARLAPGGARIR